LLGTEKPVARISREVEMQAEAADVEFLREIRKKLNELENDPILANDQTFTAMREGLHLLIDTNMDLISRTRRIRADNDAAVRSVTKSAKPYFDAVVFKLNILWIVAIIVAAATAAFGGYMDGYDKGMRNNAMAYAPAASLPGVPAQAASAATPGKQH
jgi:hypothetical protein